MSILITGAILIFAIALLAVNLAFITFAIYNLGISGLFKTIEDVFEGKVTGAEDFLVYAGIISASIFVVFALIIVAGIVIAVVGAPEEAGAAAAGAAAEESGAAELIPGLGNLISGTIGTILIIVLIVIIFASTTSGILCFVAASEIKKDPKFNGKKSLRDAYTDAIVAGVMGIAIVGFAIIGIIAYFVLRYYRQRAKAAAIVKAKKAKQRKLIQEAAGIEKLVLEKRTGKLVPLPAVKATAS